MKLVYKIYYVLFLLCGAGSYAQQKDRILPRANKEYANNKFAEAEADYRISNSKFPSKSSAVYNLGNAIYKQKQSSEAKFAYAKAIQSAKSRVEKHRAFHNLGNVFMNEKDYSQAVEAYKNALRNDPADEESRYNYALAKKMLKDNPPKDDKKKDEKKDKDKQDKKDGEKDKKDEKEKDKKDDKGDQDKQKKDPKEEENGEPKPIPGGLSKERLENLLNAVSKEEKKVQDKVNAQKVKGKPVKSEKDW